jgi:hypothetical protein
MVGGTAGDATTLPTVSPPDNTGVRIALDSQAFLQGTSSGAGVRAGVIFYCAPPHATSSNDVILSWK